MQLSKINGAVYSPKCNQIQQNKPKEAKNSTNVYQKSALEISALHNIAFTGGFGIIRGRDLSDTTETTRLEPHRKYKVPNDAILVLANDSATALDLSSPEMMERISNLSHGESFAIGRDEVTEIVGYWSDKVSRNHLVLTRYDDGIYIEDVGSLNGTKYIPNVQDITNIGYEYRLQPQKRYSIDAKSQLVMGRATLNLAHYKNDLENTSYRHPLVVGRGEKSDIKLQDSTVSSTHLKLYKSGSRVIVEDCNSTNGTRVIPYNRGKINDLDNDYTYIQEIKPLKQNTPVVLPSDCQLILGGDYSIDLRNKNILNQLKSKGQITIGKTSDNDIVIPSFYNAEFNSQVHLRLNGDEIVALNNNMNTVKVVPRNKITPFYNGTQDLKLSQGNVGDCYLLATLHAMSLTPSGQRILKNMVSIDNAGNYLVKFNGKYPIVVAPEELDGQILDYKVKYSVSGDLGVRAIERAYAKSIKIYAGDKTMFVQIDEGGNMKKALNNLTGSPSETHWVDKNRPMEIFDTLERIARNGKENYVLTCATPNKGDYDNGEYADPARIFISGHAYSIKDINPRNRTIEIVNPHNTKQSEVISWGEFAQYFEIMYCGKLR